MDQLTRMSDQRISKVHYSCSPLQTFWIPHTFRSGIPLEVCYTLLRSYENGGEFRQFEVVNRTQDGASIQATAASCLQFIIGRDSIEIGEAMSSIRSWREKNNSRMIGEVESILQHLSVELSRSAANPSVGVQSQPIQQTPSDVNMHSPAFASAIALCQLGREATQRVSSFERSGNAIQVQAEQNQPIAPFSHSPISVRSESERASPSYIPLGSGSSTPAVRPHNLLLGSLYSPSVSSLSPMAVTTSETTHGRPGSSLEGLESIQKYLENDTMVALDSFSSMINNGGYRNLLTSPC